MVNTGSEVQLSRGHARLLVTNAVVGLAVITPLLLTAWIVGAHLEDWSPVFTARAANLCGMGVLIAVIFGPLAWRRFPIAARLRGFVLAWFWLAIFVNLTWQLPLIAFRSQITHAAVTTTNLPRYISWWGYGSSDAHYGQVSRFMVATESGWLCAMVVVVAGLVLLLRHRPSGYLVAGVGAALQAFNSAFYVLENGIVDHYRNVATDSVLSPILYIGFGALWPAASVLAAVISLRFVRASQQA